MTSEAPPLISYNTALFCAFLYTAFFVAPFLPAATSSVSLQLQLRPLPAFSALFFAASQRRACLLFFLEECQ